MNIQNMKYFSVVARLENVSQAAELLHSSQSSVSKNILNLEKELGVPLFERHGKKLVLNEAGQRFLKHCDRILSETDNALQELKHLQGEDNVIRISAAGMERHLPECLADFLKTHPGVEYVIDSFWPESELPDINQVDVMIYPDDERFRKYDGFDFYLEKQLLAVSKDNPLSERASLPTRMLNGQSFVFLKKENETEYPLQVCLSQNVQMGSVHYADSRELQMQMIAQGIGAGFLPEGSVRFFRLANSIQLLHLTDARFSRRMKVCFKRDKHLSELAADFKSHLLRYYKLPGQ